MSVQGLLERQPAAAGQSLIALDFLLGSIREFAVIAGDDPAEFRAVLEAIACAVSSAQGRCSRDAAQAARLADVVPLLAHRTNRVGQTTTYVCEHFTCGEPVVGVGGIEAALAESNP